MQTFEVEQTDSQCSVTWRHFKLKDIPLLLFFALLMVACVALTREGFDGWGEILVAWVFMYQAITGRRNLQLAMV